MDEDRGNTEAIADAFSMREIREKANRDPPEPKINSETV
jgi:hypothetical protein